MNQPFRTPIDKCDCEFGVELKALELERLRIERDERMHVADRWPKVLREGDLWFAILALIAAATMGVCAIMFVYAKLGFGGHP